MRITDEQVSFFDQHGYLILDRVLGDEQVETVLRAADRVYRGEYNQDQRPPPVRKPVVPFGDQSTVHWILNARILDKDLWALATDPGLGEAAARLLRTPSVSIVEDQLLDKPGPSKPVSIHQDYSYWSFSRSDEMITCWIALVDMTIDLGPVEIIPGSHKWGSGERPKELIKGAEEAWDEIVEARRPAGVTFEYAKAVVPKGGGAFFHGLTLHGSRGNKSDRTRRACSLHWAGEACRMDRSKLVNYDYPYFFAKLEDGGRIINKYIPQVYPKA